MQRADMMGGSVTRAARVGCVVMASGEGRRFGSQKLLAPFAGTMVLERTLSAIPADVLDAVVVTRSREVMALCSRIGVRAVLHGGALQSDTVRCGLDALDGVPACMFLQGDQPLVSQDSLRDLARESRDHPGGIVRLAWQGRPASPIVFPASLFEALYAIEGDKGGSSLLKERPELRQAVRLVEAAGEWELLDIDTPADLARLEGIALRFPRFGGRKGEIRQQEETVQYVERFPENAEAKESGTVPTCDGGTAPLSQ